MIHSYRDKQTARFAEGARVPAFESFRRLAEMRLDRLEAAPYLEAMRSFPGNRLEALKGDRRGQYSIRINDRWRICFEWPLDAAAHIMSKLSITMIEQELSMARTPIHPGEHLAEELGLLQMSAAALAREIHVPVNRVTQIIRGQRAVTADTALRLGHWFGSGPEIWLNLQQLYELRTAQATLGDEIDHLPRRQANHADGAAAGNA